MPLGSETHRDSIVHDFERDRSRTMRIIQAIAHSQRIIVFCGAGISTGSGLLDSRSEGGLLSMVVDVDGARVKLSKLFKDSATAEGEHLKQLNKIMATLRILARKALPGKFHEFLRLALQRGRVLKCLTRNFDGLETRNYEDIEERIFRVHGDNRIMRCSSNDCPGIDGDDVAELDERLLGGEVIECPRCADSRKSTRKGEKGQRSEPRSTPRMRNKPGSTPGPLRPAVALDEKIPQALLLGNEWDELHKATKKCDLLLIVGTSLRPDGIYGFVREIAQLTKPAGGAVVYINRDTVKARQGCDFIDFHLQMDIDECATHIIDQMGQPVEEDPIDMWQGLLNYGLTRVQVDPAPSFAGPHCCICALFIEGHALRCHICHDLFCCRFELPAEKESLNLGDTENEIDDQWENLEPCIELNFYSRDASSSPKADRRAFLEAASSFICPFCWDHPKRGPYPHFLREEPKHSLIGPGEQAPRLVLIVFFLDEFWTMARHIIGLTAGRWKAHGWPVLVEPIKLQDLYRTQRDLMPDCTWESGTYDAVVVYITHGISRTRGYQISDETDCDPVEFFRQTLRPADALLKQARSAKGFLLCCGHAFESPERTQVIQSWMDTDGPFNVLVGCFNTRLAPTYIINFVSRCTIEAAGFDEWTTAGLLDMWLTDELVSTHSDLICMARGQVPQMWLFSPFQTRPLGKDLPSLLATCSCPLLLRDEQDGTPLKRSRKIWTVTHDGQHGKLICDTTVKVACSVCKQGWILPSQDLLGRLHMAGGLYGAVVPYFAA